jgi:hypothetical protein
MFASRHRAAILSVIIINENLKLLQINCLARKVDILFNFSSKSHYTCNRTYGRTRYIYMCVYIYIYILTTYIVIIINVFLLYYIVLYMYIGRHAVAQLVEALRYNPEGRGFDSRLCHWKAAGA